MSFERKITDFLTRAMDEYRIPGLDLSIYKEHREIYRMQMGYRDVENKLPITQNTLYNIYSNTKIITCVAAMQLYEQGCFLLDDPVSRFLPDFEYMTVKKEDGSLTEARNRITIRDLFRMSSGISDGSDYGDMAQKFYEETGGSCPVLELASQMARLPLLFEPGTKFFYGLSHEILAALIVKFTGKTFSEYLKENIFKPLGMKNTAFLPEECASREFANQYSLEKDGLSLRNEGPKNCLVPPILKESASGGLISSVNDYIAFAEALCRENILLHKRTTDLMRHDHLTESMHEGYGSRDAASGYGLGVSTILNPAKAGSPIGFGPYGWGGAAGTYASIDPENKLTYFFAMSYFAPEQPRLQNALRNVIYTCSF